jgi:hypothetical protein
MEELTTERIQAQFLLDNFSVNIFIPMRELSSSGGTGETLSPLSRHFWQITSVFRWQNRCPLELVFGRSTIYPLFSKNTNYFPKQGKLPP